ncbi:hypothetical protein AB6A40_006725 [Gnathostoma spinigerum]|uniref:K Homology domain-containing protein n=1 Tax=Gnathostoma spinigerum TaxID=75299 RepID=A0ABD6EJT7_9BILA
MVSKLLKLFRCCANVKNWRMSRRTVGKAIEKGRSKKPESDNVENKKIIGLQTVTSSEKRAKLLIDGKPKRFHGGLHRSLSDENCASCLNSATYAEKNVSSENLVCELHEEKIMDGLVRQDLEDDGRVSRTCESPCEEVDAIVPASAEYISSKDNVDDTEASDQFPFASFDLSDSDEEVSGNAVDYKSGGLENKQEETIYDPKRKRWSLKFTIEKKKVRLVTGRKGAVKRKLEEETGCHLSISRKGKRRCVWITSKSSEENIEDCRNRIDDILSTALVCASGGPKYTHFVSMPMNRCDELRDRFRNFVELVKNDASIHESCKEASLFQIPEKLHLTITMLSLDNEEKRQSAVDRLKLVVEEKVR